MRSIKVLATFEDFRTLAEKTSESVRSMEELIVEIHQCNRSVVSAMERIRNISENTAGLTEKVAESLAEQLDEIRNVGELTIYQKFQRKWNRR